MSAAPYWKPVSEMLPAILENNAALHFAMRDRALNATITNIQRYVRDYRTIRFGMGQRTGRTSAVMKLATAQDVVLASSSVTKVDFIESKMPCTNIFMYPDALSDGPVRRQIIDGRFQRLWIDDTTWLNIDNYALDRLYTLVRNIDQQFILLG